VTSALKIYHTVADRCGSLNSGLSVWAQSENTVWLGSFEETLKAKDADKFLESLILYIVCLPHVSFVIVSVYFGLFKGLFTLSIPVSLFLNLIFLSSHCPFLSVFPDGGLCAPYYMLSLLLRLALAIIGSLKSSS